MERTANDALKALQKAKAAGDTKAVEFFRNYAKKAYEAEVGSAASDSTLENLLAGAGSGLVDAGRKATNLLLPKSMTPEWASDAAIAEQAKLDRDLLDTGAGMAGNILGGAAATAPIGGVAGAGMRGAGLARAGLARAMGRAAATAPKAKKAAGAMSGIARAGGQGAAEGAVLSNPEERGVGAMLGGLGGSALSGLGRGAGKLVRTLGKDTRMPEAKKLADRLYADAIAEGLSPEEALDRSLIPLSQSLEPGMLRQVYQGLVANIPGNKVRQQYKESVDLFRASGVRDAVPVGVEPSTVMEGGDDIQQGIGLLQEAWARAFDDVNKVSTWMPKGVPDDIAERALKENGFVFPQAGQRVTGEEVTSAMQAMQEFIDKNPGMLGSQTRKRLLDVKRTLEASFMKRMPKKMRRDYVENKSRYRKFKDIEAAANSKVGTGEFTPEQVATTSGRRAGEAGLRGEGALQAFGAEGSKALKDFPSQSGIFQIGAAMGMAGAGAGAGQIYGENPVAGALYGLLLPVVGAKLLSSPAVQRKLGEGLKAARAAGMTMDEYKNFLSQMGFTTRQIAVATSVKD